MNILQKQISFAILFGSGILLMLLLQRLGVASDFAIGVSFLPALGLFLWNRSKELDRFQGVAAPSLALATFLSLGGFTQGKEGILYETFHMIGLAGLLCSVGWLFWHLLSLGGPTEQG